MKFIYPIQCGASEYDEYGREYYAESDIEYEPDEEELYEAVAEILSEDMLPTSIPKQDEKLIAQGIKIAVKRMLKDNDIDIEYLYDDLREYFENIAKERAREV